MEQNENLKGKKLTGRRLKVQHKQRTSTQLFGIGNEMEVYSLIESFSKKYGQPISYKQIFKRAEHILPLYCNTSPYQVLLTALNNLVKYDLIDKITTRSGIYYSLFVSSTTDLASSKGDDLPF